MQDMQDMIDRLNQSGKRLSKGHRKIAQYIVEHYDKAVFMTASRLVVCVVVLCCVSLHYPVIVKPTDRSGSRGITKLDSPNGLAEAIENAKLQGFEKKVLVEEFATGQEYSVEYISWQGEHHFLALTHKYTTGAPGFIETGHLAPAPVSEKTVERVKAVVSHALNSLGNRYGASPSELKIDADGRIMLIEIGGRMGGDFIGSDLVELSTGVDYVRAVIDTALGERPALTHKAHSAAAVRFVFSQEDVDTSFDHPVTDSATRFGYYLLRGEDVSLLQQYMPENK